MQDNIDYDEVKKFDSLSATWWDPKGALRTLHHINPVRLGFITDTVCLKNKKVLDVGCGGGILTEALARTGAEVTAIDMSEEAIHVAKAHALSQGLNIDYQHCPIDSLAPASPSFDLITCMELLEHVPDPRAIIQACATRLKPGGYLFVSTLNRHPKAYLLAILGAEYLLRLLPRGTHDYQKFIRPSTLCSWAQEINLQPQILKGMSYNPLTQQAKLNHDLNVNYLGCFKKNVD